MGTKRQLWQAIVLSLLLLATCTVVRPTPSSSPTFTPRSTATDSQTEPIISWDYVALGDSRTALADWPDHYAAHIEADLGVEIMVHNMGSSGQTSEALLEALRDTNLELAALYQNEFQLFPFHSNDSLRKLVSNAEVITIWTNGSVGREVTTQPHVSCDPTVEAFASNLDDIITEILSLRGSNDTIIRLLEFYHFRVNVQKELGFFEEKQACVQAYHDRLHQIASTYDIPVAPVYLAFNGPNGDEDPADMGYLASDVHISEAGDLIIANLLRQLGYEPFAP